MTLLASNLKKKCQLFSPAPQYQRMPFHGPELATKLGNPPSDGKGLDTLREALALARLPPPPPPPLLFFFFSFFFNPKWRGSGEREGIRTGS